MIYKDFKNILTSKKLGGAYLFLGYEALAIERTIDYIIKTYIDGPFKDLNFTHVHGSTIDIKNFYAYIETLPFMADKRLVLIDELGPMLQKIDLSQDLLDSLENLSEDTIVIFHDSDQELKKTTKFYKFFKKINRVVEFEKFSNIEVRNFIKKEFNSKGKKIRDDDLSYFLMLTGYLNKKIEKNLYDLVSEIDKVVFYSDGSQITRADIDKIVEKSKDSNIFNLLDSLADKNSKAAINYLHDLYEKNESMPGILYMIQRRYSHFYQYVSLFEMKKSDAFIRATIGISDFEYKVIQRSSRSFTTCKLRENLDLILQTDKRLKSTSYSDLFLMEYLLVSLCK